MDDKCKYLEIQGEKIIIITLVKPIPVSFSTRGSPSIEDEISQKKKRIEWMRNSSISDLAVSNDESCFLDSAEVTCIATTWSSFLPNNTVVVG